MTDEIPMARTKSIEDEEILALFEETPDPYMTAGELADEVGMSRQGMHDRLVDLYESGEIDRKKRGRTVGWWRV